MTKDDIILMADASGLSWYGMNKDREKFIYYLEAFANLVAAAERETITALREALAQEHALHELARLGQEIEQEPTPWRDMIVATLVREGINKHKARELADHFAAQRPWQGLKAADWAEVGDLPDNFDEGVAWARKKLRDKNT